eukprot:77223-Amorphochlora_amoeboformis.AAC.1
MKILLDKSQAETKAALMEGRRRNAEVIHVHFCPLPVCISLLNRMSVSFYFSHFSIILVSN